MLPRASLPETPAYQASKWLKLPLFLEVQEMQNLLEILPPWIAPLSGVIAEESQLLAKSQFLEIYNQYVEQLKKNLRPIIDRRLTCAFTGNVEDLRAVPVSGGVLVRIVRPVIQVQPYTLHYSEVAGKFHEMTHSRDSFAWGLLFSFPQLFQNPLTNEAEKVTEQIYPNAAIFKAMQRWSRNNTIPTPFQVTDRVINLPARMGKQLRESITPCLP